MLKRLFLLERMQQVDRQFAACGSQSQAQKKWHAAAASKAGTVQTFSGACRSTHSASRLHGRPELWLCGRDQGLPQGAKAATSIRQCSL